MAHLQQTHRIALILSAINVRRLIPGLQQYVSLGRNFWLVDIYRQASEIESLLKKWNPSGIITEWIPDRTDKILNLGYPTALVTSRNSFPNTVEIDVDNESIGKSVANHFVQSGLQNFAFYGNLNPYSSERLKGYKIRLKKNHSTVHSWIEDTGWERQYIEHWHEADEKLSKWVSQLPKPIGIFVGHDPLGRTLAETCRSLEIEIPHDVSIVGVNDDELVCGMTNPPLSSVRVPWQKMGFEAGKLIEELIKDPKLALQPATILPHEGIVVRESSNQLAVANKTLAKALNIIRNEACNGLNVKELVNTVRVSRRYLEQLFKQNLNRSPRQELIRFRIEKAKQLLRDTDFTMVRVAEECGFSSAELFATNFRKAEKKPPSHYRNSFRLQMNSNNNTHS